ncbi:MAG: alpha/beta hydrolase [Ardenticatenaceae bacterium]|nr:alpha/beta hydrolase [Ardenticatenaceae bacterium]
MQYQFAEINGTQIHYDDQGAGTAVVFIHAGIANLGMWDEQMAAFTERHRVVRYDMRGWGQTANPPGSFSDHDDLRQLLDQLGIEQAAVVGCSIGGQTAVEFAVTHPERVSKLVLVCSGLGGYQYPDLLPDDPLMNLFQAAEEAANRGDLDTAAELETHLWFDGLNRQPAQVAPDKRARAYGLVRAALGVAKGEGQRLPVEPPPIEQLGNITAPTLIIVGAEDLPDTVDVAKALAAGIGDTRRVTMADTAHLPNIEKTAEFNQLVLDFLEA